jgi:hypothetical protein
MREGRIPDQGDLASRLGAQVPSWLSNTMRTRGYVLMSVALVIIVITFATLTPSHVTKFLARAQHHYLGAITPVEEADAIFNGGSSTPSDHSKASTNTLVSALVHEVDDLNTVKWPSDAAFEVGKLIRYTREEIALLITFETAPVAKRPSLLSAQSVVANHAESENESILKELKLPTPTNAVAPAGTPQTVP